MKFQSVLMFICLYINNVKSIDCYWNMACKYNYFSSKTPYEIVRGDIRDSIVKPKGCMPVSVWSIMRHGKRNPGIKFARNIKDILKFKDFMISSYESGNSSLCAQDIDNLKNWKVEKSFLDKPNEISEEGYQELFGIGSRLKEALPELLNELREEEYLFHPAFGRRNQVSAEAFIDGLKNKNLRIDQAADNYNVGAPYTTCEKFQVEVLHNPGIYHQVHKYIKTVDYIKMKDRIERRLGLNFTLTYENIIAMHDVCRYSWKGMENKPSPWCALFSIEDMKVLEYIGDLEHYYRNGYGASFYSRVFGQITLADMLKSFEDVKHGRGKTIVTYFTHATMLDMILVALDLYKDESPLTSAYRDMNRKWRTTFLSTFAGNMIAILNRCKGDRKNEYDYNVSFYWNEQVLTELCNKGVCSWQQFEDKFVPFLNVTADFCEFK